MTNLPNGWQKVRFGDIFKVKYGKAIDKALRKESARYPVVGSAGIMTYTDEPLAIDPTIVIGRKGNVGSIQIFENGCYPIDTTYYMQPASQFDIKFLTLLLTSLELVKLDSSTATPSLRREDLENVSFFVPPLPEQQKIVEILEDHLSRLDVALADVKQAKLKAAQFRRSLLQAAFTGNLTGDGTRLMMPVTEWKKTKLVKVVDAAWGDTSKTKSSYVESGFTAFSASGPDGFLDYFDYDQEGIVLSAIGANCGKVYFASGKWSCIKNTMRFLVKDEEELSVKFLFYALSNPNSFVRRGSGQPFIRQQDVRDMEISYPPLPEQQKIVELLEDHLSRLDASVAIADAMERQSASLRRSLLQAAFTGQLTKEVASV